MRVALFGKAPPADVAGILSRIWLALEASPFRTLASWRDAVVVLRDGTALVTSRPCHASWLRAHDLPELARECLSRRLGRGEVLVFLDHEGRSEVVTRFVVVDLAREARALKGTHP